MDNKSTSELLKSKWESTGLLESIKEDEKINASWALDEMSSYLISLTNPFPEEVSTVILPIMVRIMRDKEIYIFDIEKFFQDVCDKWDKREELFNHEPGDLDDEAEFCAMYVLQYEDLHLKTNSAESVFNPNDESILKGILFLDKNVKITNTSN